MGPKTLLVEDCAPMREAVSRILQDTCDVVGYADDGNHALAIALEHRPHVIILDISLPGVSGMALLPLLRASLPETVIVILTNHNSEDYRTEAIRRGADAYVLKTEAHENLLSAVTRGRADSAAASVAAT